VTELDELIEMARRYTPHVHEHYRLGPSCTVRAVTFGDEPSGMPYLLPEGWTPVLSADGKRVTLEGSCKRCEALEARLLVLEEMLSPSKVHGDSWTISVRE
jgi:hypothetical protein